MTDETVPAKAARYLAEGRVKVRLVSPGRVEADVRGNLAYTIVREGRRWACDCPARRRECCHVQAVRLVT